MKTLSGVFALVISAVIVIVTILSCQTQRSNANRRPEYRIGNPDVVPKRYVELKHGLADEVKFHDALATLKYNGGDCQIYFLRHAPSAAQPDPKPIFNYCDQIPARLKTDKITRSEAANDARHEESTANDPHATYRVASPNRQDIDAVKDLLSLH